MADKPSGIVSPEIERLSERLQKDPNSKIFFNLAEEYYKGGMLEEAFLVLQTGLKSHPSYISAKVLLGKIYLDQSKAKEAREIFEQILKINPDNIIVNKKLALIYLNEKSPDLAEKCCNQILFFNSKDADALSLLHKIREFRKTSEEAPVELKIEKPLVAQQEPEISVAEPKIEKLPVDGLGSEVTAGLVLEPVNNGQPDGETVLLPQEAIPLAEIPGISEVPVSENKPPVEIVKGFDFSDIMKEEEVKPPPSIQPISESGKVSSKENLETTALAELYIKQGHYEKGIEIYQKLLDQDPYNETVRQQLEDAKTIGNLLGAKDHSKKIEKDILETILPPEVPVSSEPRIPPPVLSSKNQMRIERLKQWLETLKTFH